MKDLQARLEKLNLIQPIAILGAGVTGRSAFDLLLAANIDCVVLEESDVVSGHFSNKSDCVVTSKLTSSVLEEYETLIVSPGLDLRRPVFKNSLSKVVSDTELFGKLVTKPIIGVTGSNGKSTVVSLLETVLSALGKKVALCGNIGEGVLTALLQDDDIDYYVVELSSYQLERAPSLLMEVGVLLNLSPDHLDRYDNYLDYVETKTKILSQSKRKIINLDDDLVVSYVLDFLDVTTFGEDSRADIRFDEKTIFSSDRVYFLMENFSLVGKHNAANVAAVFAVVDLLGYDLDSVAQSCQRFEGLPSRCKNVADVNEVLFINDSKGTNVGATVAAINGLSRPIVLLLGGQGKSQDFSSLADACKGKVKHAVVFGEDRQLLADALAVSLDGGNQVSIVDTLDEAFETAVSISQANDIVLLSPACASFDQFPSYLVRGEAFETLVRNYKKRVE